MCNQHDYGQTYFILGVDPNRFGHFINELVHNYIRNSPVSLNPNSANEPSSLRPLRHVARQVWLRVTGPRPHLCLSSEDAPNKGVGSRFTRNQTDPDHRGHTGTSAPTHRTFANDQSTLDTSKRSACTDVYRPRVLRPLHTHNRGSKSCRDHGAARGTTGAW